MLPGKPRSIGFWMTWLIVLTQATSWMAFAGTGPGDRPAPDIPEPLRPWVPWVLAQFPERLCPQVGDSGPTSPEHPRPCTALTALRIDISGAESSAADAPNRPQVSGTRFTQSITVYSEKGAWVALPGHAEEGDWPVDVRSGAGALPVITREGWPQVFLPRGSHTVTGRITHPKGASRLTLPAEAALVTVTRQGRLIDWPAFDTEGHLLIAGKREDPSALAETGDTGKVAHAASPLALQVYRLLTDAAPFTVETRLRLQVSGSEREVRLGPLLAPGEKAQSLRSDLPVRLDSLGHLRIRLRPGLHWVEARARQTAPLSVRAFAASDSTWPDEEWWAVQIDTHRPRQVTGLAPADPSQTEMPAEWRSFPAYRLLRGDSLTWVAQAGESYFKPPRAGLRRRAWLDFSGDAFTFEDRLNLEQSLPERFEAEAPLVLSRAEYDGHPVPLTVLPGGRPGFSADPGQHAAVTLARRPFEGTPLRAGWGRDLEELNWQLVLPPGFSLLHASGPDRVSKSWVGDWSLWDIFLLCLMAMLAFRVAGPGFAFVLVLLGGIALQEDGFFWPLWLNALAGTALFTALPPGRLRKAGGTYALGSALALAVFLLPFAVHQVQCAVYPQLALEDGGFSEYGPNGDAGVMSVNMMLREPESEGSSAALALPEAPTVARRKLKSALADMPGSAPQPAYGQAEAAHPLRLQTGPGRPQWSSQEIELSWSGPVTAQESLRLWILPPWALAVLRVLRAFLPYALLAFAVWRLRGSKPLRELGPKWFRRPPATGLASLLSGAAVLWPAGLTLATGLFAAHPVAAQGSAFPSDSLLQALSQRLMPPSTCAPGCLTVGEAWVRVEPGAATVTLDIDAADSLWAALPSLDPSQGRLLAVTSPAGDLSLRREGQRVVAALAPGRHRVTLSMRLRRGAFELHFSLKPAHLAVQASGFTVSGLEDGRLTGEFLAFTPGNSTAASAIAADSTDALHDAGLDLPPFVRVRRTFQFGPTPTLTTEIERLSPAAGPLTVAIPLMPYEKPTTPGLVLKGQEAYITLPDGQNRFALVSSLPTEGALRLKASSWQDFVEVWSASTQPGWHLAHTGLAPAPESADEGKPVWMPLPGDTLVLRVHRAEAAEGPTRTVEAATLVVRPGERETECVLHLSVRSGQGDEMALDLPAGMTLRALARDGQPLLPAKREGRITLPLQPGLQNLKLEMRAEGGVQGVLNWRKTLPAFGITDPVVNLSLQAEWPHNRWILWVSGPKLGPALRIWGFILVLLIVAVILGRSGLTPLRVGDWALLVIGLAPLRAAPAGLLLLWFVLLRTRPRWSARLKPANHNRTQMALFVLSGITFLSLIGAVPDALLHAPDMWIIGNGSTRETLRWFQDRLDGTWPQASILSLPLWAYRLAMLLWSLWLAMRLIGWLKWGWERLTEGGLWREVPKKAAKEAEKTKGD